MQAAQMQRRRRSRREETSASREGKPSRSAGGKAAGESLKRLILRSKPRLVRKNAWTCSWI